MSSVTTEHDSGASVQEPVLVVQRHRSWFLRRRFLRRFAPAASLATVGFIGLLVSANLALPFERMVMLEGAMGANAEFFEDERVKELLLQTT